MFKVHLFTIIYVYTHRSQGSSLANAAPIKAVNAVEDTYNINLSLRGPVDTKTKRTEIDLIRPSIKEYRYMFEKIKDRADGKIKMGRKKNRDMKS